MKQKYSRFFIRLIILTLALFGIAWIMDFMLPEHAISRAYPYILILFFLVTASVHFVLLRISALKPQKFVTSFMLATLVKLVIYLIVVLVYVFSYHSDILSFILTFFVLYLIYTAFEVIFLLSQTREVTGSK